jgi:hypothetical protein
MLVSMRAVAILALVFATGVAACGGSAGELHETGSWDGPQRPYPDDGVLPVEDFRTHAEAVDADWERDPEALAREFTQVPDGTVTVADGRVTLLRDSLEDDSVRAERYLLELEREGDVWELVSARWEQRCHEQRGHQEFSPELCV